MPVSTPTQSCTSLPRREVLRALGAGALIASVPSLAVACTGVVRSDLEANDRRSADIAKRLAGFNPALPEILYHASLAPSGHNAQPWIVRVVDSFHLRIAVDPSRALPAVDPRNRELLLSIGAFLENLTLAAGTYGFAVDCKIAATMPTDSDLLDVTLRKGETSAYPLERIQTRRMVRSGQQPREISRRDLAALAAPFGDRLAYFPRSSPEGRYLSEGTIEANRAQAYRDHAQRELADWIRLSDESARANRDGLTPASLEIGGVAGWYVRHFMTRETILTRNFRDQGVDRVRKQLTSFAGWLVVTSADSTVPTLIETGRRWQRMALGFRERMLAMHPMTQLLEEAAFTDRVAKDLRLSGDVQFLLRVGYLERYPDPVSLRRPVGWFTELPRG